MAHSVIIRQQVKKRKRKGKKDSHFVSIMTLFSTNTRSVSRSEADLTQSAIRGLVVGIREALFEITELVNNMEKVLLLNIYVYVNAIFY